MNSISPFWTRYRHLVFVLALIIVFWLVWAIKDLLIPFFLGIILAYLVLPVMRWLEKKLPGKGRWQSAKRISLIVLVFVLIVVILGVILNFSISAIINSTTQFFANLSTIIKDMVERLQSVTDDLRQKIPPEFRDQVDSYVSNTLAAFGTTVQSGLLSALTYLSGTFGLILGFLSLPMFLFYILKDNEKLWQSFYSGLSPWMSEHTRKVMGLIASVLGRYIRASIVLALVVGLLDLIGLMILGIPYAPLLALFAAVTELIPIIGPWLGGAVGVLVTLATDSSKTWWVIILYFAVQQLEGNVLVPRIHGNYLQVHPAIILVLVVIAAQYAGLWGMLLVVPLTSLIVQIYKYLVVDTKGESSQSPPDS